jgi:hypothetical protein
MCSGKVPITGPSLLKCSSLYAQSSAGFARSPSVCDCVLGRAGARDQWAADPNRAGATTRGTATGRIVREAAADGIPLPRVSELISARCQASFCVPVSAPKISVPARRRRQVRRLAGGSPVRAQVPPPSNLRKPRDSQSTQNKRFLGDFRSLV